MNNDWILRDVWEQTARLSPDFAHDMNLARAVPAGRRPYDVEYVLPDYSTTTTGLVRIPPAVQEEMARQERLAAAQESIRAVVCNDVDEEDDDDDNDEDYNDEDAQADVRDGDEDVDDTGLNDKIVPDPDDGSSSDDDEESPEQVRKRIMQEREMERRRRDQEAQQQQVLNVSVERFAIPEALFRPSDVGFPTDWANVPQAIVQAITACPLVYRAGLYQSIQLTGGLSRLPNLVLRLEQELRPLVPTQFDLRIALCDSASVVNLAWKGAARIVTNEPLIKWGVTRQAWEQSSKRGVWKPLLQVNGGYLV
jgi:Actin